MDPSPSQAQAPEQAVASTSASEPAETVEPIVGLKNCKLVQQGAEAVSFFGAYCSASVGLRDYRGKGRRWPAELREK